MPSIGTKRIQVDNATTLTVSITYTGGAPTFSKAGITIDGTFYSKPTGIGSENFDVDGKHVVSGKWVMDSHSSDTQVEFEIADGGTVLYRTGNPALTFTHDASGTIINDSCQVNYQLIPNPQYMEQLHKLNPRNRGAVVYKPRS